MECKCKEINLCQEDRTLLNKARDMIEKMYLEANEIETKLDVLINSSPQAYKTDNIEEICTAIDKLDDDIEPSIKEWLAEVEVAMECLAAKEEEYVREDREFHKSLRKIGTGDTKWQHTK